MEAQNSKDMDKLICKRYEDVISYYDNASVSNKRWYKLTRSLTVIFGALVTLIASLTTSKVFIDSPAIEITLSLATPVLAALLTVIAGFSQSFQWGSAWQNMILTAEHLQKEYDKYLVTPEDKRNYEIEAEKLNTFVINESKGFFERMLGTALSDETENE